MNLQKRKATPKGSKGVDTCPGSTIDAKKHKCNVDYTNRVCVKLLDDDGSPMKWGDKDWFEMAGKDPDIEKSLERATMPRIQQMQKNGGSYECISMWRFASNIMQAG